KLPYDTERDLTPVGFINRNPLVLVGRKALPPNTLGELIAHMRGSSLNFAHPGAGTTGYITTALFLQEAKLEAVLVPYRGAPPAAIEKLDAVLHAVLDDPAIVNAWAATGVTPYPPDQRSPQAARALFKSEIARWSEVVRENKIQPAD